MNSAVRELTYSQAIQEAMAIALESDPRVFLMGEDIGVYGGAFQVTGDLVERFGTDRVMFGGDWPVCNNTSSLRGWVETLQWIVRDMPEEDKRKLFAANAIKFYGLKHR